jgi:hypothetical protein
MVTSHSPVAPPTNERSKRALSAGLNRVIVAVRDEGVALSEAARYVDGEERRKNLLAQASQRASLQSVLAADVFDLGGVPARAGSYGGRWRAMRRGLTRLLAGAHQGDAYEACALAAQRTSAAYAHTLRSGLGAQWRERLELQLAEVDRDCEQLRRLRWGDPVGGASTALG